MLGESAKLLRSHSATGDIGQAAVRQASKSLYFRVVCDSWYVSVGKVSE